MRIEDLAGLSSVARLDWLDGLLPGNIFRLVLIQVNLVQITSKGFFSDGNVHNFSQGEG
jgi:hypothetical protein